MIGAACDSRISQANLYAVLNENRIEYNSVYLSSVISLQGYISNKTFNLCSEVIVPRRAGRIG
jgi:hypothetical protein